MTPTLTDDQRRAVDASAGEPVRLIDPATNRAFVLLSAEAYDRVAALAYDATPWTDDEMDALAAEGADLLGWDGMDAYQDDPA
jgi:hypothetical protein